MPAEAAAAAAASASFTLFFVLVSIEGEDKALVERKWLS